jgi:hypothetical protein
MRCQCNFKRCLALVVALIALPQPQVLAQSVPPQDPTEICKLTFTQERTIPELKTSEILVHATETANNLQELLASPSFSYNSSITRQLPQLWKLKVPLDSSGNLPPITHSYNIQLKSSSGQTISNSKIQQELLPVAEISRDFNTKTAVVQGGVRLLFQNLSSIKSNTYSGTISVTVDYPGSNCP